MQEPQKDYYGLLGIAPDASDIVIKKAYKRLALRYHPDKNSEDANAQENFQTLQEAYDVLVDSESKGLYDLKRELWGFLPNMFLPPATKSRPPESQSESDSKNKDIKEAFRKARLREKLEAARLHAEKEKLAQEEEYRRVEQEKLQALAAERIRAAREALQEERRLEEDMRQQTKDQERLHRIAAERIKDHHRVFMAREESRRRAEEARKKTEEEEMRAENRRQEEMKAEQSRQEEELAEKLRQFGLKTPKGIAPNNWNEAEIDCLLQWKREGVTWTDIAQNMNAMFDNSRSAISCRRKYIKMERAGET